MVVPTTFYFILKEPYWLAHQQFLLEHWACPHRNTSLDPQVQNKANVLPIEPTFVVYIHEIWTLGKPYGIKLRCCCQHMRERIWEQGGKKHLTTCDRNPSIADEVMGCLLWYYLCKACFLSALSPTKTHRICWNHGVHTSSLWSQFGTTTAVRLDYGATLSKILLEFFVLSLNVNVFSLPIRGFFFWQEKKGRC